MKTLKEVKEYFKNAELVESITKDNEGLISEMDERGIHEDINAFWFTNSESGLSIMLYDNDNEKLGFAKILKTK